MYDNLNVKMMIKDDQWWDLQIPWDSKQIQVTRKFSCSLLKGPGAENFLATVKTTSDFWSSDHKVMIFLWFPIKRTPKSQDLTALYRPFTKVLHVAAKF